MKCIEIKLCHIYEHKSILNLYGFGEDMEIKKFWKSPTLVAGIRSNCRINSISCGHKSVSLCILFTKTIIIS